MFKSLIGAGAFLLILCIAAPYAMPEGGSKGKPRFVPVSAIPYDVSIGNPFKAGKVADGLPDPFWTDKGLVYSGREAVYGLSSAEKKGGAVYDPTSGALYASVNGCIVRLHEEGRMEVILDNVQGTDIDVRAAKGLAVAREPDDGIILYKWKGDEVVRKTLVTGGQFFNPQFSPDGSLILLSESRPDGGHFWIISTGGESKDLGQGYGASWLPDGENVIFSRIAHDGEKITSSELWIVNIKNLVETKLTDTEKIAEIEPAVSPDGKWLTFVDAKTGEVFIAGFPGGKAGK